MQAALGANGTKKTVGVVSRPRPLLTYRLNAMLANAPGRVGALWPQRGHESVEDANGQKMSPSPKRYSTGIEPAKLFLKWISPESLEA